MCDDALAIDTKDIDDDWSDIEDDITLVVLDDKTSVDLSHNDWKDNIQTEDNEKQNKKRDSKPQIPLSNDGDGTGITDDIPETPETITDTPKTDYNAIFTDFEWYRYYEKSISRWCTCSTHIIHKHIENLNG